jgi:AraC-like DNA-binding protein
MADIRELAELIEQNTGIDGEHATAVPRLFLHRLSRIAEPLHTIYEPAVCLVAQGTKRTLAGDNAYIYSAGNYLVVSVGIPIVSQLLEASPDKPFLTLRLDLDPAAIGALMLESDAERAGRELPGPALDVSTIGEELLDAAVRLLRLLASPRDIPILAPLAEREILYRLLRGEQTSRMSQIAFAESKLQQVNRAIGWIKHNFREAFSVQALASQARMSASALHQHFRVVTGMSPLQYQKQLRLQEARRLMLAQAVDAAVAGHSVGYESPSQFSREYRRLFGAPPLRDIQLLRARGDDVADQRSEALS